MLFPPPTLSACLIALTMTAELIDVRQKKQDILKRYFVLEPCRKCTQELTEVITG